MSAKKESKLDAVNGHNLAFDRIEEAAPENDPHWRHAVSGCRVEYRKGSEPRIRHFCGEGKR